MFRILFLGLVALAASATAHERVRPRRPGDLPVGAVEAPLRRVKGARVAALNLPALLRDFPRLRRFVPSYPRAYVVAEAESLCRFLESQLALVSPLQASLTGIRNTAIPFDDGPSAPGFRFPTYGRTAVVALVLEGVPLGYVELKGAGHAPWNEGVVFEMVHAHANARNDVERAKVRGRPHLSGVLKLSDGFRETVRQRVLQEDFAARGYPIETVETYLVLELPFDVLGEKPEDDEPAALYVRQVNYGRQVFFSDVFPLKNFVLADQLGNYQKTAFGSMVDFESVYVVSPRYPWFPELDGLDRVGERWVIPSYPRWQKPWGREQARAFRQSGDRPAVERWMTELSTPTIRMDASRTFLENLEQRLLVATAGPRNQSEQLLRPLAPYRWVEWFDEGQNATERTRRARLLLQASLAAPHNLPFPIYVTQYALQHLDDRGLDQLVDEFPASAWEDFFGVQCRDHYPENNHLLIFDLFRLVRAVERRYGADRNLVAAMADYLAGQEDGNYRWHYSSKPEVLRWLLSHFGRNDRSVNPGPFGFRRGLNFRMVEQDPNVLLKIHDLERYRDTAVREGALRVRRESRHSLDFRRIPEAIRNGYWDKIDPPKSRTSCGDRLEHETHG